MTPAITKAARKEALWYFFHGDGLTDHQLEDLLHFFEVTVSSLDMLTTAEPAYKFAWLDAVRNLEKLQLFDQARKLNIND